MKRVALSRELLACSASASIYSAVAALPAIVRQEKARPLGSPVQAPDSLVQASNSAGTPKNSERQRSHSWLSASYRHQKDCTPLTLLRGQIELEWIEKQHQTSQELQRQPEVLNQERLHVLGGNCLQDLDVAEEAVVPTVGRNLVIAAPR